MRRAPVFALGMLILVADPATATSSRPMLPQQPAGVVGTRVLVRSAAAGLEAAMRAAVGAAEAGWIGYEVPAGGGDHYVCCRRSPAAAWTGCDLRDLRGNQFFTAAHGLPGTRAERRVRLLFKFEDGRIQRLSIFHRQCDIDAGDDPVIWLHDASPSQSVAFLAAIAESRERVAVLAGLATKRLAAAAVDAIGVHATSDAIDALIQIGRGDTPDSVRHQALFWLSQAAGERAVATLESVVEVDPDVEIKKHAVFALGQLPSDRGVPLLVNIALTHASPAVRERAIFWLGQSDSPAAFDFIVGLLERGDP